MQQQDEDSLSTIFHNFIEGVTNIFIFLPYFFSISALSKTLFAPWKNLTTEKKKKGFSFDEYFGRVSFNLISRGMGFAMRSSVIIFYFLTQAVYILLLPFVFVGFLFILPLYALYKRQQMDIIDKKILLKNEFIEKHTLAPENKSAVEAWFEYIYPIHYETTPWWKLENLMSTPPLARDWSKGFTPTLDNYSTDLTGVGHQSDIYKHVIGRDKESKMLEEVLSKSDEANAIIVGEDGVGKHTIVNAFARRLYLGRIHPLLAYKRLLHLNLEKVLTQALDTKQRESLVEDLFKEAAKSKSAILLIDNFDRYVGSGKDRVDLSIPIEKEAKTANLQVIGITTPFLYQTYVYPNKAISNIFSKIDVEEIDKNTALWIALEQAIEMERRYQLTIPYETIHQVIEKGEFYITSIPFPEKALQLLDSVCSHVAQSTKSSKVLPEHVGQMIEKQTHTPTSLTGRIKSTLLNLEEMLRTRVIGQDHAITEVASALRRSFLLLGKRKKPLASFLFLGPTGVGKTETAKAIAEVFFGKEKELMRFDMSLYQTKDDITKLIGSVEKLNPGLLTNMIRENPYGVLLLDEIEKAHKDLLNIFLTILDEGYFFDGYGQRVDCKNLVIVATSNAGAEFIFQGIKSGEFNDPKTFQDKLIDFLIGNNMYSPEFLNRFDGVVAYNPLQHDTAFQIAKGMIADVQKAIFESYKVQVVISEATLRTITDEGYNPQYGARNLQRILRQQLEDKIAKAILANQVREGGTITL